MHLPAIKSPDIQLNTHSTRATGSLLTSAALHPHNLAALNVDTDVTPFKTNRLGWA